MTGLLAALDIGAGDVVSVVGAGGKTTLIYRLAEEGVAAGLRVLVTTTTHMGTLPEAVTGPVFVEAEGGDLAGVRESLVRHRRATLLGRRVRPDKLEGIAPERVDALAPHADLVVVEADGARGRSLKMPAEHEPVVASATTVLVVMVALDALGQPLDERVVHRLLRVQEATGRPAGSPVDEDLLAAALLHPEGYLARVPPRARALVFLNKAEDAGARGAASRLAGRLLPLYERVAAGSARTGAVEVWRRESVRLSLEASKDEP